MVPEVEKGALCLSQVAQCTLYSYWL